MMYGEKKYSSATSERTEENNCLGRLPNNNECCRKLYAWISLLTFSITNCYCCVLWGRRHNKLGTIVKDKKIYHEVKQEKQGQL